jgi:hypothetical protein
MVFERGLKFPGSQLESLLSVLTKLDIVVSDQVTHAIYTHHALFLTISAAKVRTSSFQMLGYIQKHYQGHRLTSIIRDSSSSLIFRGHSFAC